MAGSSIKSAAMAAGIALGSSGIIILVGGLLIGMVLLSLIPIYTSNDSQDGFGEIYRIPGITLKIIYTNQGGNLTGGGVVSTAELSDICTAIFRATNTKDFYACLATNFTAFGPSNDTVGNSPLRRRRAIDDAAAYQVGDISLLFSSTCANRRALSKWFSRLIDRENSSCLARRATACRSFITTPNNASASNQWLPFPAGYSQIVYTNVTGCVSIPISKIFNVASSSYSLLNTRFNITRPAQYVSGDCRLESIVSKSFLKNLVDAAMNPLPSTCTTFYG